MGLISRLLDPVAWKERAIEQSWIWLPGPQVDQITLTWPVDRGALRDVVVRFPRSYNWKQSAVWGAQIKAALARWVRVEDADLPQPFRGVINLELVRGRRRKYQVVIENSDYAVLNEEAYTFADLHFKMQYSNQGYGQRDHLLPGSYVNRDATLYSYLPRLRQMRDRLPPKYDVYGRFGLCLSERRPAIEKLRAATAFTFHGGEEKIRYRAFLAEAARSRVVIDLPGVGSLTFRCMDYLAIGCCIIAPPHTCQLQYPLKDRVHVAYCRQDYSDIADICTYYLDHEEERSQLIANSRRFFDAFVHRDQLATYYLHHCLSRFPG